MPDSRIEDAGVTRHGGPARKEAPGAAGGGLVLGAAAGPKLTVVRELDIPEGES